MKVKTTLNLIPWKMRNTQKVTHILLGGSVVKDPPANSGDAGDVHLIPGQESSPGEEIATHSSILAWKIPWKEEPWCATVHEVAESDMTEHAGMQHAYTHLEKRRKDMCACVDVFECLWCFISDREYS